MTTLAIIGGRDFTDYVALRRAMDHWFGDDYVGGECNRPTGHRVSRVVSGGARGADSLGARWAKEHGVPLTEFLPDWDRHGKGAGFLRNEDIVAAADVVLAMWDGTSRGTAHSLGVAKRLKKTTIIVYY